MTKEEIIEIIKKQQNFYKSNITYNVSYRLSYLNKLYKTIKKYEDEIINALYLDLGKSRTESYMCEIGMVLNELSHMIKHIKKYNKPKKVKTPLAQFKAKSYTILVPYGNVLVMSPWNYPFLLSLDPTIEAISSGNTVLLKTSRYSENTNKIIKKIIEEVFPKEYVCVIFGGKEENTILLEQKFDYIFFTGSKNVGSLVYEKAAKYLTPITLELGGKSPCIIDETANIKLAAKRIIFGKLLNVGQTCVAPDYIYCHEKIHDQLIHHLLQKQV